LGIQNAIAKGTPYDAGYSHGCSDAKLTFSERYINQQGKGPSFHTPEFMSGYDAAFSACGHESSPLASNADGGDSNGSSSSSSSSKSENYNDGYRGVGVAAAARDNEQFNNSKIRQIDGDHPHTRCTLTDIPDYCKGYKKGYSEEVVYELD
jgi:hypothetical protein